MLFKSWNTKKLCQHSGSNSHLILGRNLRVVQQFANSKVGQTFPVCEFFIWAEGSQSRVWLCQSEIYWRVFSLDSLTNFLRVLFSDFLETAEIPLIFFCSLWVKFNEQSKNYQMVVCWFLNNQVLIMVCSQGLLYVDCCLKTQEVVCFLINGVLWFF